MSDGTRATARFTKAIEQRRFVLAIEGLLVIRILILAENVVVDASQRQGWVATIVMLWKRNSSCWALFAPILTGVYWIGLGSACWLILSRAFFSCVSSCVSDFSEC